MKKKDNIEKYLEEFKKEHSQAQPQLRDSEEIWKSIIDQIQEIPRNYLEPKQLKWWAIAASILVLLNIALYQSTENSGNDQSEEIELINDYNIYDS